MAKAKKKAPKENKTMADKAAAEPASGVKAKSRLEEPVKSMPREIVEILMYGLSLLFFCKGFVWQNFQIPTSSMENTLLIGDHITANTFIYKPASDFEGMILPFRDVQRSDIVVFKYPGAPREDWIKRCVGVPGDRFQLKNDQVYINGEKLDERYPFFKMQKRGGESDRDPEIAYRPRDYYELEPGIDTAALRMNVTRNLKELLLLTKKNLYNYRHLDRDVYDSILKRVVAAEAGPEPVIPEGFYLMMGDNRNHSFDSREWGLVPREFVQGKAYFRWWSYGEDEGSHNLTGIDLIKSYLRVPIEIFRRTHIEETFTLIR